MANKLRTIIKDGASVTGLDELLKKLDYLSDVSADKVLCSIVRARLTVIGKQMKADVLPQVKGGRNAVKTRFKRNRRKNWVTAKVGFHVGKKRPVVKSVARPKGKGVGISANNIHWWVAGTNRRMTKTLSPNVSRGAMPAMQPGLASIAAAKSQAKQNAYMIKMGANRLEKELAVVKAIK